MMRREHDQARSDNPYIDPFIARQELIDAIDGYLSGDRVGQNVSAWAEGQLDTHQFGVNDVLVHSAFEALSQIKMGEQVMPNFRDTAQEHLKLLKDALSGKADYQISYRMLPPEEVQRLVDKGS